MAQNNPFFEHYEQYRQQGIEYRRFDPAAILSMIKSLQDHPRFSLSKAGSSVQGRDIFLIKAGSGPLKVLLWSQMHGDEPTATMALLDIFNFLKAEGDELQALREQILQELTLYFVPMLNPDGAAMYQRRNAIGIDLNRDALRLQSPEARLLKSLRDSLQADWGFNLHDQSTLYSAGQSNKPATISFLAPPYDAEQSANEVRSRAMRLIVELNDTLQQYIPGQIGKWFDEFEPRAFGDNMQKWGTSTVLIESGGYLGDPEKQFIRKLNFVAILQGLSSIATNSYAQQNIERYHDIPLNGRYLFNLIIREAVHKVMGEEYVVDIGINRTELAMDEGAGFYYKSSIEELGDMSVFYGYEEINARGMQAIPGKIYPKTFRSIADLEKLNFHELLSNGYTTVQLQQLPDKPFTRLPLNLIEVGSIESHPIDFESGADFILEQDGKVRYTIVNGFVYDVQAKENSIKNALVGIGEATK